MRKGLALAVVMLCVTHGTAAAEPTKDTLATAELVSTAEKAQRIVSLSLCTDQILLQLVDSSRIAALSYLARDPLYSNQAELAKGLPFHHGAAEEIVPLQPDLILDLNYSTGKTSPMLRQLGYDVKTVISPRSIVEVEIFVRAIGKAVGEQAKSEELIVSMQQEIAAAQLIRSASKRPELRALSYSPNGYTSGEKTIKNEVFALAGLKNVAAELGIEYYGTLSVEQLLQANPDVLVMDEMQPNENSLAQAYVNHPVIKRVYGGKKTVVVPMPYWLCPGPSLSKAVMTLVTQQ